MRTDETSRHSSASARPEASQPEFIDGYFTQRMNAGDRPQYGYPANHLPDATNARMEIVTSFMASHKSK